MSAASQSISTTQSDASPRLLGISAAAKYLGATSWFVRTLIWERRIPYCRFGKRLLLDKNDLDSFVATQKVGAR
jgi:excisionase family DNA binding protein